MKQLQYYISNNKKFCDFLQPFFHNILCYNYTVDKEK